MDPHEQQNNITQLQGLLGPEEWAILQCVSRELDETTMPHDPNETGLSEDDVYKDLCKILNWSEAEALEQQERLNTCMNELYGLVEEDNEWNMFKLLGLFKVEFSQIISTLRNLAQRIRAHTPGPIQQSFSCLQPPQLVPVWENLNLTANEQRILESVANFSALTYTLDNFITQKTNAEASSFTTSRVAYLHFISPVILATQSLWLILEGRAQLRQCQAPIADKPTHKKCENYVISGNKAGREAQYCSDTCRKRANRRQSMA